MEGSGEWRGDGGLALFGIPGYHVHYIGEESRGCSLDTLGIWVEDPRASCLSEMGLIRLKRKQLTCTSIEDLKINEGVKEKVYKRKGKEGSRNYTQSHVRKIVGPLAQTCFYDHAGVTKRLQR
ncbi:hypothetical protein LIER_17924 [Lithospermum erythrorhizon]|uniref:Uncharacterized protein n=1 Tax=Lithospermum erythrorhizon TaxID=34254 RepID=A0AAV3QDF2_LITER